MDLATPLRPGSRSGFTTIPNWLLDDLFAQGSDAVALGVLLVRLIPGQSAAIALSGPTSRASLAKTLGWGEKNWRRFQAALTAVCSTGGASYSVENCNTPVVAVAAELSVPATPPSAQSAGGGATASLAGPPAADSAGPTHARIDKPKKEKKEKNSPPAGESEKGRGDLEQVLAEFTEAFGARPSPSERLAFVETAADVGATAAELRSTLVRFAEHPYLAATTTSPMRLLYETAADRAASRVDAAVRRHIAAFVAEYDRRGAPPCEDLKQFRDQLAHGVGLMHQRDSGGSKMRPEVFLAKFDRYYERELRPLSAETSAAQLDPAGQDLAAPDGFDQWPASLERKTMAPSPSPATARSPSPFTDLRQLAAQFGPGGLATRRVA